MSKYKNRKYGQYKSNLEAWAAEELEKREIPWAYEPFKINLIQNFEFPFRSFEKRGKTFQDRAAVRGVTYTPDFVGDG